MLNEADTRAKRIDPALATRGWDEALITREVTARPIVIMAGRARRVGQGRADYLMRVRVGESAPLVALAVLEAKEEAKQPGAGLDQAKEYADLARLNVPFVYSSNGHLFVEFDGTTGYTSEPRPMADFPTPDELRARWEAATGVDLSSEAARPLLQPYRPGSFRPRYYQDAATRAALQAIAVGKNRLLLSLGTGTGKTFIAAQILRRVADAGQLRRALFVCDRDALRVQGIDALTQTFDGEVAEINTGNLGYNARVSVSTYQSLDVATDEAGTSLLLAHFPADYFSHVVLDECHRSAWGKWRQVLEHNPSAVQIGLTATPRRLVASEDTAEAAEDLAITADNYAYFGEPVYDYDMAQGMADGFLAACEISRRDIFLERAADSERDRGLTREDLERKALQIARTGEPVSAENLKAFYAAPTFESSLLLPERVDTMVDDLFAALLATGGPEQKTIVFCTRDRHAEDVAVALNNRYQAWCAEAGRRPANPYAFRCTADNDGSSKIADFESSDRHHWIATTVDLLSTGVDIPKAANIVFFKYVRSPMALTQMIGRGTRIYEPANKLMFRVYDYTNATRLLGEDFTAEAARRRVDARIVPEEPAEQVLVHGVDVRISEAGKFIIRPAEGRPTLVALEEYEREIAERLREEVDTIDTLRARWVVPSARRQLLDGLPESGNSVRVVQELGGHTDVDLFDILANLGWDEPLLTRAHRAFRFRGENADWLRSLPPQTQVAIAAIVDQFVRAGTDAIERKELFQTPELLQAGGLDALARAGDPRDVITQTKQRVFA